MPAGIVPSLGKQKAKRTKALWAPAASRSKRAQPPTIRLRIRARLLRRLCFPLLLCILTSCFLVALESWTRRYGSEMSNKFTAQLATFSSDWENGDKLMVIPPHMPEHEPRHYGAKSPPPQLHLLIPLTTPNLRFCKSLASAILNNYPPPILINFNATYSNPALARGGKLRGISNYLRAGAGKGQQAHHSHHNQQNVNGIQWSIRKTEDYVLIVDGFDVWFQLPPSVLLTRFLHSQKATSPRTKVLFGADKACWPNAKSSDACTLAPESPLPKDVYGSNTDRDPRDYLIRPRWLNSGTIIGTWSDVGKVYEDAVQRISTRTSGVWSDQGVLADVWGAQQRRRKDRGMTTSQIEMDPMDYGIAVDGGSELFMTMTHSHKDLTWLDIQHQINDSNIIGSASPSLEQAIPELQQMNKDAQHEQRRRLVSTYPWLSANGQSRENTLHLARNIIANTTPPVLHFNGEKFPLEKWWGRMWWFHLASESKAGMMMKKHIEKVRGYLAGSRRPEDGSEIEKDLVKLSFGGAWTDQGEWLDWDDEQLCGPFDKEEGGIWVT
ncbi:hypothetical protein DFH27DRAFT_625985 [Peziza echinospora]|nr:hypothetical protein DFH27DRAFT_625985 [Peziza echinospora]